MVAALSPPKGAICTALKTSLTHSPDGVPRNGLPMTTRETVPSLAKVIEASPVPHSLVRLHLPTSRAVALRVAFAALALKGVVTSGAAGALEGAGVSDSAGAAEGAAPEGVAFAACADADADAAAAAEATAAGALPLLQLLMAAMTLMSPLRATMTAAPRSAVLGT